MLKKVHLFDKMFLDLKYHKDLYCNLFIRQTIRPFLVGVAVLGNMMYIYRQEFLNSEKWQEFLNFLNPEKSLDNPNES